MRGTTGVDFLVASYGLLSPDEQEDVLERKPEVRLRRLAGDESETARMIRSLQTVREHLGEIPTPKYYNAAYKELRAGARRADRARLPLSPGGLRCLVRSLVRKRSATG